MSIEILQGTAVKVAKPDYPEDITVVGMGPCTGVIIFDQISGDTYGAHLTAPHSHESGVFTGMLSSAAADFATSSAVEIHISGCCDGTSAPGHNPKLIRAYMESQVSAAFTNNANIKKCWPTAGITSVDMGIDSETGEFFIEYF